MGSIPGSERSPGGGNGNQLQYSCLENPYGQRSLVSYTVHGVTKCQTQLRDWAQTIISSVQSLSRVWLFVIPWTPAHQASLSIANSQCPPRPMSIESVMPSNHLILCRPLLLLPSIFPNMRVFSIESVLHIRWPEYWSFSFNISPSDEHSGLISFRMDWLDLLAVQGTLNSLLLHHSSKAQFFCVQLSL